LGCSSFPYTTLFRSELDAFGEEEYRRHLVAQALRVMQADFKPATWKACWEHAVLGRPAAEVAKELGLTPGAVHAARFRVACTARSEEHTSELQSHLN